MSNRIDRLIIRTLIRGSGPQTEAKDAVAQKDLNEAFKYTWRQKHCGGWEIN